MNRVILEVSLYWSDFDGAEVTKGSAVIDGGGDVIRRFINIFSKFFVF